MEKLLIKNGRVIDPANNIDSIIDVLVEDGRISRLANGIIESGARIIDAAGKWVVPGLIDVHVHLREPGYEHKETVAAGSRAAALGGFTTICCMPNTDPVADNEVVVEYILLKAAREAVINVLPIGAITKGQEGEALADIGKMAGAGICAISDDGRTVTNAALLKTAMKYAAMFDLPVLSHCEDVKLKGSGQIAAGEQAELLGLAGISRDVEDVIIARDVILAAGTGTRLHICHICTKGGVDMVRAAQAAGVKVTAEAAPHHFTLTDKDIPGYDANYKMSPPLRSAEDVAAVKAGLADGTIGVIATDHAPHHRDEKNCEFDRAANGIVGLETALPLAITELVETGVLTPGQLIEKLSVNPARLINSEMGTLTPGAPADITVIDPAATYEINPETFASKGRNTPFGGRTVRGRADYTICGGRVVMAQGVLEEKE